MVSKNKKIPLQTQLIKVIKTFPNWKGIINKNILTLTGEITPTALSSTYKVKVIYSLEKNPKIKVISPTLTLHPPKKHLPHVYTGNYLCLHNNEFSKNTDYLSETIIIWISWWLYFYEIWLTSGEWLGGGTHQYSIKSDEN